MGSFANNKFWDQTLARTYIYYPFMDDIMSHDSYYCWKYPEAVVRPFPTRRIGEIFVGYDERKEMTTLFIGRLKTCPEICRPKYGKHWTYC